MLSIDSVTFKSPLYLKNEESVYEERTENKEVYPQSIDFKRGQTKKSKDVSCNCTVGFE